MVAGRDRGALESGLSVLLPTTSGEKEDPVASLHQRNVSLWVDTTPETDWPTVAGNLAVDVAVVGGGITGLSVALLLKREGATVALIESGRIASGATGYTTAKVTSQHGLVYRDLVESLGEERARLYAEANQAGLEAMASLVDELGISCDFHRAAAHVYSEDGGRIPDLQAEAETCQRLGLPAQFVTTVDLPYSVAGAVRFDAQARFHPRKYCLALAAEIPGDGSHVFEMSRVLDVDEGDPCEVVTASGTVRARQVILATQLPILDRGAFFTRASPSRSYVLAARVEGPVPDGMYISADEPVRSLRPQETDDGMVVLVGGEGHRVGAEGDTQQRYEVLETWARERFAVRSIPWRWSAQDYMPVDNVPYIGRISFTSERVYVATGYRKWGMTTGTVAGMILADTIMGRDNRWAPVFDATRLNVRQSAAAFFATNATVAKDLVEGRLGLLRNPDVAGLARGEGGIVDLDGEAVAAFRDDTGQVHAVSPTCTHLGCVLQWNTAERSWDCPCHGSRFGYDGQVIQGPAVQDLERREARQAEA